MDDLAMHVDVIPGATIESAIEQMVALATKLGIAVESNLNGVKTRARPGVDPVALHKAWENELDSKRAWKYAII